MHSHLDKIPKSKSQPATDASAQKSGAGPTFQFIDDRPEVAVQRSLQEIANNSPQAAQLKAFQDIANSSPRNQQLAQLHKLANEHSAKQEPLIQKKPNNTGLPDNLKAGIENLSGYSMDDVKVHRNSDKPAPLQAHAYAQGTDIHLGPGQEKHLPHEAWHVVQQKQGRVKPTLQMKGGTKVNDDAGLEKEADVIGVKSLETGKRSSVITQKKDLDNTVAQLEPDENGSSIEQQELLELAEELEENKPNIKIVSGNEVNEAISTLQQLVQSGDESKISKGLKAARQEADKAEEPDKSGGEIKQMSGWRFAGAIIGGILGTIVGAILGLGIGAIPGAIIGGKKGWDKGKRKDDVNRLIAAGATANEVDNLLALEPNIDVIYTRMTTVVPGVTLAHLLYSTNANGRVGSIYFTDGRVRLVHNDGPAVSMTPGVQRYVITEQQGYDWDNGLFSVQQIQNSPAAVAGMPGILAEVYPDGHDHVSRGGPIAFNYALQQHHLNVIANIAQLNNNDALRNWMNAFTALAAIPMN